MCVFVLEGILRGVRGWAGFCVHGQNCFLSAFVARVSAQAVVTRAHRCMESGRSQGK